MKLTAMLLAAAPLFAASSDGDELPTWDFVIPQEATGYSFKLYDSDHINDDLLAEGDAKVPEDAKPGSKIAITTEHLRCEEGEVVGDSGSSGEGKPNVYAVITWEFPGGATTTVRGDKKKVACEDLGENGGK